MIHPILRNPFDFAINEYFSNLEINDTERQLIDAYVSLHGYDVFQKIFSDIETFYYQKENVIIQFNTKICFESTLQEKRKPMKSFF